ncbi:MAG: phosphatidylserine decarboxylase [Trichlorobacter sp.]|uniref:phosphatidylserine decarboxylase n=1 Tax=Trichlorobacter sp. TaxID=2911007 RepID=UPI002567A6FA|nr:phosphatidylserine decarboxylase [Trichlorobacter sp.]MDK9716577.1 phosphatidylserine decarboxylase [Trichlorobacter sp.]
MLQHQYIERDSGAVVTEQLLGDRMVQLLYHQVRENSTALFRLLTSSWSSQVLGAVNFDRPLLNRQGFAACCGIDLEECLDPPHTLDTARKVFERRIRYEQCRPMPDDPAAVVSPADARVIVGSLQETELFFLKDKFFSFEELIGPERSFWRHRFANGDFALFRLTPDKYHYNHLPVSGKVVDFYSIDGAYHCCNPTAVVSMVTPYSKNKRVVTLIDTDVEAGSRVGLVAMVEVVALMIGDILQAYSHQGYDDPQQVRVGMFLQKGQPKSLYRPGSSTDILLFQPNRVCFSADLLQNQRRSGVVSRFTQGFEKPLVETDIRVRSLLALKN